ncbi:Signal transduction histidine kinase [Thalassobacillus cyri]|uniref:histidine kinase n=1 Tax=Thalassobacillus cyri TaxID=571932 RepID=A0A1H4DLT7_9BACI|nr:HAMP domain-containing sensor histidine kinase [Thalassobacillus cyri]SEA73390.1 Signal transduction histidine kinase [Thalassobacillus cyri]
MKLLHQLNVAFTTLIIIVMSITAFILYSLILNMLIEDEKRQLEGRGELLIELLNEEDSPLKVNQLSQLLRDSEFRVLMFDRSKREILFSTLPPETAAAWASQYDDTLHEEDLWESQGQDFVVYDFAFTPQADGVILVLATPLRDLQAVQTMFAWRMIFVLFIGLLLAVAISHFMNRRLVTPLIRLKTELKKIEHRKFQELKPVKASGEIEEVEHSVRTMAAELENYIRTQKQFFQNASHELKTPLMSIQGYAEGIRDGVFEGEAADKGLSVMIKETERLKKIVNEMILLAKLDSDENVYHPENMDIDELIEQAKEGLYPLAREKGIELDYEQTVSYNLYVDPEKVMQALINIIANGIRHAESNVQINTRETADHIIIAIKDDGIGISEEILPQLFERFIKGKEGETGLGLAISRAIIERSGGKIVAQNNKDAKGTTFKILLPKPTIPHEH